MDNLDNEKSSKKFECTKCHYTTSRFSQYARHLDTKKHKWIILDNEKVPKGSVPCVVSKHVCLCGKEYLFKSGLCKHKNKCKLTEQDKDKDNTLVLTNFLSNSISKDNIFEILKQNQDFKTMIMEQNKHLLEQNKQIIELSNKPNITQYNTNCNNKFNLNFFLNEQCKNALNITEFVNSIDLKIKDLEIVGKLGYVDGISQIILNGLKELDIYKRPMHCSDLKREIVYVKDENKWEKENADKNKMKNVIKEIANKNIKQIPEWIKENPEYKDISSNKNDKYIQLVSNCMNGDTQEEQNKNIHYIIKNVQREIIIEKIR